MFFHSPQVDHNVTRHLTHDYLKSDDWHWTFLHFLGLDHIGHLVAIL
jgi:hypothetical protein